MFIKSHKMNQLTNNTVEPFEPTTPLILMDVRSLQYNFFVFLSITPPQPRTPSPNPVHILLNIEHLIAFTFTYTKEFQSMFFIFQIKSVIIVCLSQNILIPTVNKPSMYGFKFLTNKLTKYRNFAQSKTPQN